MPFERKIDRILDAAERRQERAAGPQREPLERGDR